MEIKYSEGEGGPGVSVILTGDEVAMAIESWLGLRGVGGNGPRVVTVNGDTPREGHVYVGPDGFVAYNGQIFRGRAPH